MNILFNALGCGLGNNGGSKTIVKSAQALINLDHYVQIASKVNNYTWGRIITNFGTTTYDFYDVVVNVSVWDVATTLTMPIKKKVWWLRGWEQWVRGEEYLINQIKRFVDAGGKMIVNSSWLIKQLKEKCGVDSVLCYSGLDLDFWHYVESPCEDVIKVGALWHPKHKTKNYAMFEKLKEQCDNKYFEFHTLKDNYNDEQLRRFYSELNIWLSLSSLEGFHQVPAEAALCGCHIIYNDIDSGGTRDYCTPETADPFTEFNGLLQALESPDWSKRNEMQKVLENKIGSREDNMKKFVEVMV